MKRLGAILFLLTFLAGCAASTPPPKTLVQSDRVGKPTVFCKVLKEPDPQLLGKWKCVWNRWKSKTSETDATPIEYYLAKYGDQYGLLFFRSKEGGEKIYAGWRNWVLDGKEIKSDTGIKIFTENGEVFFQWQYDKPVKMTRMEEKRPSEGNP